MQTTIIYNDVLIKDILTDGIRADAVKEGTGVDQLGVTYSVSGTGVIHMAAQGHLGIRVGRLQTDLHAIIQRLTKDRRKFVMQIGGLPFMTVQPGAVEPSVSPQTATIDIEKMDIDNGPIPQIVITKIIAGVSATIQFTFKFTITNCGVPGRSDLSRQGLVNFRLWMAEHVDCRTWLTTRTFQGRIRVAHKNVHPHALARVVAIPPIENGFRRDFIRMDESSDGLHLDFAFQDNELVASAPYNRFAGFGASAWSGRLVHSTDTMGATSNVQVNVRLEGPKSTSILELADLAFRVIAQKLQYDNVIRGKQAFFEYFEISEELSENAVECSARIKHTGNNSTFVGLFQLEGSPYIGQPMGDLSIGYDSNITYIPPPTAGVATLFLSKLQSVCHPSRMPFVSESQARQVRLTPAIRNEDGLPTSQDGSTDSIRSTASPSQLDQMYFAYRIDSKYHLNSGRIALATGAPASQQVGHITIANLHRETCIRQVIIEASRLNAPPQLPNVRLDFQDLNGIQNARIGTANIEPSAPQLSADARNLLYECRIEAWYAMAKPPTGSQRFAVGAVPYRFTSGSDAARSLPSAIFVPPQQILS